MDKAGDAATPGSSGGSGSATKRKRVYSMEPRTPLKRQRIPVERFQSPVLEDGTPKLKPPKEEIIVHYKKGVFLAVRGAENSFYLCKSLQKVTNHTKQFRIHWLSLDQPPNVYKIDYIDHTEIETILTNVSMDKIAKDTFRLPHVEKTRTEKVLRKAIKAELGEPVEDEEEEEEEEEAQDETESEEDEESPKKAKLTKIKPPKTKAQLKIAYPQSSGSKKDAKKKKKTTSKPKGKDQKSKGSKVSKEVKVKKESKKGPDRKLKPNPKIKILEKDPFFETKQKVPFISIPVQTKLVFRAVGLKDMEAIKELIASENQVYRLDISRSVANKKTAIDLALEMGNKEVLKTLLDDVFDPKNPRHKKNQPKCLIETVSTGSYNPASLNVGNIRNLNMSRGGKEGNNAFTKDFYDEYDDKMTQYCDTALRCGVDMDLVEILVSADTEFESRDDMMESFLNRVDVAVAHGQIQLAKKLVEEAQRRGGFGFNFLHKEALDINAELQPNLLVASVRKRPFQNHGLTPIHCAAINPNITLLTRLFKVEPDINIVDKCQRRPIHFAAACQGTAPLELLLNRGASISDADSQGNLPTHCACMAGRSTNLDKLLVKAKAEETRLAEGVSPKWGPGGVNRPNRSSLCPMHIAVENGYTDVVKILLKHGADVNKQVSASKFKRSPLMMAAEKGFLDIARLLVQNGAIVELQDKLKRTALMHAAMNGSTPVASYLLFLGADPSRPDSSGNTAVHYASAYGWYFCLKMLVADAGADPNVINVWKTSPVAIAFLKGHLGLVDFLLTQPNVDVNFRDDNGLTLVSVACSSRLEAGLLDQVQYLVNDKGADPALPDLNNCTALHHLAANNIKLGESDRHLKVSVDAMDTSVKIAKLLIEKGCDPSAKTTDGKTPLMLAVERLNTRLVKFLVEHGGTVSAEKDKLDKNVLHLMAEQCMTSDLASLLQILAEQKPATGEVKKEEPMEVDQDKVVKVNGEVTPENEVLKTMVEDTDQHGMTPLLRACYVYKSYKAPHARMTDKELDTVYQFGRDFIRVLIELTGTDVNKTIQQKQFVDKIPVDEKDQYIKEGKYSMAHLMVEAKDRPAAVEGVSITHPGLKLVLDHAPNLEIRNIAGLTPLMMAVEAQKDEVVKLLLENGSNPNVTYKLDDGVEMTPLLTAARNGNVSCLKHLVNAGASVAVRHSKTQKTPLHYVVQKRDHEAGTLLMTKSLLMAGAEVNAVDEDRCSPLHLAVDANEGCSNASTDLEEFLIEKGADVFGQDGRKRFPLHYAFIKISRRVESTLLDPIELCGLLTSAMRDKRVDEPDSFQHAPLHLAAFRGATICCMHLLQRQAQISRKDKDGNSPLSLAVLNNHDSCAIMLIQKGASVTERIHIPSCVGDGAKKEIADNDKKKERPILKWRPLQQWAKVYDEKETYTIFQGAIKSELQGVAHMVLDKTGMDFTAVQSALSAGKYNVLLRLLKRIPDSNRLHTTNTHGQNLFHLLGLKTKPDVDVELQLKVAEVLRQKGCPVGLRDHYGCTPLHYTALHHHSPKLGSFLIENDPTLNLRKTDNFGRDVLAAFLWDFGKITSTKIPEKVTIWMEMLFKKGAVVDIRFNRPLPDPLLFGTAIFDKCPDYFSTKEETATSPLILAIHHYYFGMARYLLEHGASPDFPDSRGITPLMHVAKMNDVKLAKLLLNPSYNPDTDDTSSDRSRPQLMKKMSRNVFVLKPDGTPSLSEDPKEDEEQGSDRAEGEAEGEGEGEEENQEDEEQDNDVDDELDEEVEDDDVSEREEDSDHDTDIIDSASDTELVPLPTSLGSKQASLRKEQSLRSKDSFATVEKTSSVDLGYIDSQGWTVVHHVVCPLRLGTFDGDELLYVLAKAGASLDVKDNAGLSPLDHALISGAPRIAKQLQKLMKIEPQKQEKSNFVSFDVSDGLDSVSVDFNADAEKMIEELDKLVMDAEDKTETKPKADKYCNIRNIGELLYDKKQNIPYSTTLSKVDVSCGAYGMYNFYKMQIVVQKGKDIYVLFTRWGRIGDSGQFQHTPFQKAEEAIKEFCKVFRSKTGNDWNHLDSFENHPKKYRLVPYEDKRKKAHKIQFELKSDLPSKLPLTVQDIVNEMSSVEMLTASVKKVGLDPDFMPFGRIKKPALISARLLLQEIGDLIEAVKKQQKNLLTTNMEEYHKNCEQISKLTSEYYHLVPVGGFEYEQIRPIENRPMLKKHMRLVADLTDLEVASRMLLGAQHHLKETNPLDYIYHAVGCAVQPLVPDSLESQYLLTHIQASSRETKVHALFKLSRSGEEARLADLKLDNHRLLWHGSNLGNMMSILHRGLLIAPVEVPITGHLFGEGIYFSDAFSKSKNYCSNYGSESSCQLMLLCEVALGRVKERLYLDEDEDDHLDPDINSVKVIGRRMPDPEYDVTLPFGPQMSLGPIREVAYEKKPRMMENEFIVHDAAQVCLRYLVLFSN